MPIYEFRDKETGETWEEFLSMSAKEEYLAENPHAELVIGAPAFISGIAGVTHKNDDGFKDLLNRIGNANPGGLPFGCLPAVAAIAPFPDQGKGFVG